MSHRHTVETKITDKAVAIQALKSANISYSERGNTLYLTSGNYDGTTIDLSSGRVVSADTDHSRVSRDDVGILRQHYAEALHRSECIKQGVDIQSRHEERINGENCVVLHCRMA